MFGLVKLKRASGSRVRPRDKLRKDVARAYQQGQSIRDLSERVGRSYGFVHQLLAESGVTLRSRGGPNRYKRRNAQPASGKSPT
ncbi:MAG TPA: helix-turn-helix domain-containing protein [Kribbella sp.]|jgi:transposase